jgi:cytochrome c
MKRPDMTPLRWFGWLLVVSVVLLMAAACQDASRRQPVVRVEGGDVARGEQVLVSYGCTSCHTVPGIRGADATVGPPLDDWADRWYIAGLLLNEPDHLMLFIQAPQSVLPGGAMPDMGVTTSDARDMAAYLYTLHRDR